jgi:hypothetical protein
LREALATARAAKANFLAQSPDILRQSGQPKSIPVDQAEVARIVREERDRAEHRHRMTKRAGRSISLGLPIATRHSTSSRRRFGFRQSGRVSRSALGRG